MARDHWFRNTARNAEIEATFMPKLKRARDKAQPPRIQAGYLARSHPDVALRLLDEFAALGESWDLAFPVLQYDWFGVRAIILQAMGRQAEATSNAREALERAKLTTSGFRYHAELDLVGDTSDVFGQRIFAIAEGKTS